MYFSDSRPVSGTQSELTCGRLVAFIALKVHTSSLPAALLFTVIVISSKIKHRALISRINMQRELISARKT